MSYPEGTRVGPYEIQHPLGAGGMGEVYRARDTKLGRDVALKILPEAFARDPDRRARFEREAQILASLNHPNIAAIYGVEDAATAGSAHLVRALVLELVDGPTLAEPLRFAPLPLDEALPIARQIVEALDAAHAQGVVHRDLKPANIKLRPDGTVKVLDFGLARLVDPAGAAQAVPSPEAANSPTVTSPALTRLGVILGTAAYMAPEQARGRQADKRADIWAFGCVLFEMLTGRRAFHGETVSDTLASVLRSDPDWSALPLETPEPIRRLLRRCLVKDVQARLSDIGVARLEIADALAAPATARPAGAPPPAPARAAWPRGTLLGLGAIVAGLIGFLVWQARPAVRPPTSVRFLLAPPPGARFPTATTRSSLAISPDGRLVAFRAYRPGEQAALWIRALDSVNARELKGTLDAQMPFWSPDSRALGFFADGKLKKIDVESGTVQTVCDAPAAAGGAWALDGTIVVGHATGGLSRLAAGSGQLVELTTPDAARRETHHVLPVFLPDGRRFLYTAQPGNTVYLASLDSDARTRVMDSDSRAQYAPPGYLVFGRQGTVMAQPFDPASGVVSGEPVAVAERVQTVAIPEGGSMTLFSVSNAGVLVYEGAVEEPGGTPVWVDRDGRELGPVNPALGTVEFPRFSPDGRRLALIVNRDLWVDDLQGRPPIRLTFDGATSRHYTPLWTNDGRRIVYETVSPSPLRSIAADASSTAADDLTLPGHFHPVGWSPSGTELLAVEISPPDTNVVSFALATNARTRPTPVVETPGNDGGAGAALSPDGRWLAYASNATGRQEVWVRPYPGPGAPVRVSPSGGDEPVWSRDGRELFYLEVNKMMAVSVSLGANAERAGEFRYKPPVQLYEASYLRGGQPPTYDVSPDGRFVRLKAPVGEEPGNQPLGVVVNWLEGVAR
ncbi:MAG: protein kinase [Acidobacteria bacterium]|nr:protein kinase [Acidobacteriota bacterium]